MFIYGQTAANAIGVMSYLAMAPDRLVGSGELAEERGISQVLAAKLLTRLAAAGLVEGRPGPGGGYRLARLAAEISLVEIVSLFEQVEQPSVCPFGKEWCGVGEPCPLHDEIVEMVEKQRRFLTDTRLSVFEGHRPSRSRRDAEVMV